jgi:hypothetical protein
VLPTAEQIRDAPIEGPRDLWNHLFLFHGVKLANSCVCPEHSSPWHAFKSCYFNPPAQAMIIGPRGGGKSFMAGLRSHRRSRERPKHRTRILGGSLAQSGQIQDAIKIAVLDGKGPHGWDDKDSIEEALAQKIKYRNGSEVEILAASTKSVRGPHVPDLNLDEIDEMDRDVQQAAVGMAMDSAKFGVREDGLWGELPEPVQSTILMTSTWHRPDGPVGEMLAKAEELNAKRPGTFPVYKFCSFDVLERCPDDRSGPALEQCPACPLVKWCHDVPPGTLPKAKRGNGHYSIRSLIQKAESVSERAFEADYLCKGPRVDGLYFPQFDPNVGGRNVPADGPFFNPAEFNPNLPVILAIDPGNHTGAVFMQVIGGLGMGGQIIHVNVFADYYKVGVQADQHAINMREIARTLCNDRLDEIYMDPAAKSVTMTVGPTALAEYERGGLKGIKLWASGKGSVANGIALIEGLIRSASGHVALFIHPRCKHLIGALQNYRRARVAGVWLDHPEDPQHPQEDMVDPLRCGLSAKLPMGRTEFAAGTFSISPYGRN